MTSEFKVSVPTADGPMDVHGFAPGDRTAGLPAVIVLQEAFGVNPHMKRVCRRVAELGYTAFCPELFHRTGAGLEFGYDEFPKIRPILGELTNERIGADLRATYEHVARRPDVDPSRIAAWGFCMGGWAAVLACCELPLAAGVSFYGGGLVKARPGIGFTPLVGMLPSARCPLLFVFGGKDAGIPAEDIGAIGDAMRAGGKAHEIEVYPEGGHGFFCEDRTAYEPRSAEAAWGRATAWLQRTLG
jgi:carboxymethylenebutenolidase